MRKQENDYNINYVDGSDYYIGVLFISVFFSNQFKKDNQVEYPAGYEETMTVMTELGFPLMDFESANGRLPTS